MTISHVILWSSTYSSQKRETTMFSSPTGLIIETIKREAFLLLFIYIWDKLEINQAVWKYKEMNLYLYIIKMLILKFNDI